MFSQKLFRSVYSRTCHETFIGTRLQSFRPPQYRSPNHQRRAYRPVNYRHLLTSWNTIRLWVKSPLFYYNLAGLSLFCGLFYAHYLERVPVSSRLRFNIISQHWEEQLAKKYFQQYMGYYDKQGKILEPGSDEHRIAERVFDRMKPHSGLPEAEWDMVVFRDDDHSAFVLPGGKVFISTGLIDFCKNDDEVASMFGHEMAHTVCHHSAESISRSLIYIPALLISWLVTGMDPDLVEIAIDVAFRLPGSRVQEREADYLGLVIMAESGYDPSSSLNVWCRWEEIEKHNRPSYLSTHPSHHSRALDTDAWLAAARSQRLQKQSSGHDFQTNYYLQRSFCGLDRTPVDIATRK